MGQTCETIGKSITENEFMKKLKSLGENDNEIANKKTIEPETNIKNIENKTANNEEPSFIDKFKSFIGDFNPTDSIVNPNLNNSKYYKYKCPIKKGITEVSLNLKFILSKISIGFCCSHNPMKKSVFVTEINFTQRLFPLITNYGFEPIVEGTFELQKQFTFNELENSYLKITVYEFEQMSEGQQNEFKTQNSLSSLNQRIRNCNYLSYFEMDLLSFLFRPNKCDFALMGQSPISPNARIFFNLDIEHRSSVGINANTSNQYINQLSVINKESVRISRGAGRINYQTGPITINELKDYDILLESDENKAEYYYSSLNNEKAEIIKNLGYETITNFVMFIKGKNREEIVTNTHIKRNNTKMDMTNNGINNEDKVSTICVDVINNNNYSNTNYTNNNLKNNKPNNNNYNNDEDDFFDDLINKFKQQFDFLSSDSSSPSNQNHSLSLNNLPIITQMRNVTFTELGYKYNTSFFYMINNDKNISEYKRSQGVLCCDIYPKISSIYDTLLNNQSNPSSIINSCDLLFRYLSISSNKIKLYFHYQSMDELNRMVILLMDIFSSLSVCLKYTTKENEISKILKVINLIIRRQELNNDCICYCIRKFNGSTSGAYSKYYSSIFQINSNLSSKLNLIDDTDLIELYAILYFRNRFLRQAILNSLCNSIITSQADQINIFLYETKYDEELNRYLAGDARNYINNILRTPNFFSNLTSGNHNKLLKYIFLYQYSLNVFNYPFDFTHFKDNQIIMNYMKNHIRRTGVSNLSPEFLDCIYYLTDSIIAFNEINNAMITSTNAYDQLNIYKLFEYQHVALLYYYEKNSNYLLMDYSLLEKAINILFDIDNMMSTPKIFWFYYHSSHLITRGHIKWFIINICNNKFKSLAYHWSMNIRFMFFKTLLFTINHRIKQKEGKYFKQYLLSNLQNKSHTGLPNEEDAINDFQTANTEYEQWLKGTRNGNESYPELQLDYVQNDFIDGVKL